MLQKGKKHKFRMQSLSAGSFHLTRGFVKTQKRMCQLPSRG